MKKFIDRNKLIDFIELKYRYNFSDIFKRVFENIEIVFVVSVIEIDLINYVYDLVSKLKFFNKGRVCFGRGLLKIGFFMIILVMIFMNGIFVFEEDIWKFLNYM